MALYNHNASARLTDRDQLIEQHRSYVRALAVEIARSLPGHIDLEELISCGTLGLVEAAERYDPRYRVSFHTFAWYRIRGAIYDALRQMGPLSRGDYATYRRAAALNDLAQTAAAEALPIDGRPLPAASVEGEIAATQTAIDALIPAYLLSLDSDEVPDVADQHPSSLDQLARQELQEFACALVAELTEDDRRLIEAVYFQRLSLVEYATRIGVTKSWASRLHARAIKRLRELMVSRGLLHPDE